jgi:hypothetical protein
MLTQLPSELTIQILRFLPLRDLSCVQQVSRASHNFFVIYEDSIYHAAAEHHNFLPNNVPVDELHDWIPKKLEDRIGTLSWKRLCE